METDAETSRTNLFDIGKNSYECEICHKTFGTEKGLKIHLGKKCKKKTKQHRSSDRKTCNKSSQEPNHSGLSSVTAEISSCSGTDGEVHNQLPKKPKVLWPAANEKGKYKCLEEEVYKKEYNRSEVEKTSQFHLYGRRGVVWCCKR